VTRRQRPLGLPVEDLAFLAEVEGPVIRAL